jgi:hypothetical protein
MAKIFSKILILILLLIFLGGGFLIWQYFQKPKPLPPFPIPEYSLPLKRLPENYQRDIVKKFGKKLTKEEKEIFLENGVLILAGKEYDKFENAFSKLKEKDIPIFVTSDSLLHLFHIEFNEILKNLEIKKLSPMLKEFLKALIEKTKNQYNSVTKEREKEILRRNLAYLAVAKKLLDPDYKVPSIVESEVKEEIKRIEDHKGFYKSPLFSLDCPRECLDKVIPFGFAFTAGQYPQGEECSRAIKGMKIPYQGKIWDSLEFYKEICTRKCYCEDYSQYLPRGHYTLTEGLKRYFKAMIWLGRMTFKARGDDWTKQALYLTLAAKSAKAEFEGKEIEAAELWKKIYSISGFFAGASDDLTFSDYAKALNNIFTKPFTLEDLAKIDLEKFREELRKLRGPKILGGFELDLAGNLKDLTQGLRLIGQRYALDSQILGDLVYKNIGPNPKSPYYEKVLDCPSFTQLSQPKEFYFSCQKMAENKEKYWNEVCSKALECDFSPNILYSVCRLAPSGLDIANIFDSKIAKEFLDKYYDGKYYCDYEKKEKELKDLIKSFEEKKWFQNLYNSWLWLLQPILKEKPKGYPVWMRTNLWKLKDLITALASWAELRHDTILYVKQSYTWGVAKMPTAPGPSPPPIEAKYYGYVEPNPELFARLKYAIEYLEAGLKEQEVITEEVSQALKMSSQMVERLKEISEKELKGEELIEKDYNFIKNIDESFNSILEKLASALTIKPEKECPPGKVCQIEISLAGKEEAFKTSMIADVHTETNSKKVLEVGTGKIDWLFIAHKAKGGRIGIAVGPIFSYYEFFWPMEDRLTDEKWRKEVLNKMERPIWYKEAKIKSSKEAYIIK